MKLSKQAPEIPKKCDSKFTGRWRKSSCCIQWLLQQGRKAYRRISYTLSSSSCFPYIFLPDHEQRTGTTTWQCDSLGGFLLFTISWWLLTFQVRSWLLCKCWLWVRILGSSFLLPHAQSVCQLFYWHRSYQHLKEEQQFDSISGLSGG